METNALLALLARAAPSKSSAASIASLLGRIGLRGIVIIARGYLGPLAPASLIRTATNDNAEAAGTIKSASASSGLSAAELAILGLAATKLVFEIGELSLYNPTLDPAGKQPKFELDANGRAPAMSIAHVIAAMRLWQSYSAKRDAASQAQQQQQQQQQQMQPMMARLASTSAPRARVYAARTDYYATASRYSYSSATSSSKGTYMPTTTTSSSRGCSSCGGSRPTAQPTPTYDPCTGALPPAATPTESGCSCGGGCGCSSCKGAALATTKTYDSDKCPTFAISCETKQVLRDCVKTALCDFLRCLTDTLCPDGRFDSSIFDTKNNPDAGQQLSKNLVDCVGTLACSFMHCLPEALCPPVCEPAPSPIDCVPCDYAVEVVR